VNGSTCIFEHGASPNDSPLATVSDEDFVPNSRRFGPGALQAWTKVTESAMRALIEKRMYEANCKRWHAQLVLTRSSAALSHALKGDDSREVYLRRLTLHQASLMLHARMGILPTHYYWLAISRNGAPAVPAADRVCRSCNSLEVETIEHFITCPTFKRGRVLALSTIRAAAARVDCPLPVGNDNNTVCAILLLATSVTPAPPPLLPLAIGAAPAAIEKRRKEIARQQEHVARLPATEAVALIYKSIFSSKSHSMRTATRAIHTAAGEYLEEIWRLRRLFLRLLAH
jgi:hypothetical protein